MSCNRLSAVGRDGLLDLFIARCEWTRVWFAWRPNVPDEADNHLTELAVAGAAPFIFTHNLRDLHRAELGSPGLRCLAPAPFLKEIAPRPP